MSIEIEERDIIPVAERPIEFVERKGVGHPDSLIDGIVENISLELCKAYMEKAGQILHHNVDKGLIIGGASEVDFGKGRITRPIEVILTGRATTEYKGKTIPVDEIAIRTADAYLRKHTRFLDVDKEVRISSKIVSGSSDLNGIFSRGDGVPLANDTSFGIGFAPFTETERLTLETETFLNSSEYKKKMPMVGEDIKVMGVREHDGIMLTIAIAFVSPLIKNIDEYIKAKETIVKDVKQLAKKYTKKNVEVAINTGDSHEDEDVYLTKTGLSCEAGDDGSVGRGNRTNGLITPFRHMSLEAAAGKNPINHVGKIYSILSTEIAKDIVKQYPVIRECNVAIVSQIGRRIDDPKNLSIDVIMEKGQKLSSINSKVKDIAQEKLNNIATITRELTNGKYKMF
jgi:S-adenosylmethionine synthetase